MAPGEPPAPHPKRPAIQAGPAPWQERLHEIIFEADTPAGKAFDVALLVAILLSVVAVMLESVEGIRARHGTLLLTAEWLFTVLFTIEYGLRLACVRRPLHYARSFFGGVDLLSILPTYLSVVLAGTQSLLVIRTLRLVRVFRIFKLGHHVREAQGLLIALRQTRAKITVFLVAVLSLVLILGSTMYLIEGGQPDTAFTSIPRSLYWAIVTMTTVGYGDISPQTALGQALASVAMILGYTIIVVPTGIFSVEVLRAYRGEMDHTACPGCGRQGHDVDASHCKSCGESLAR